ncbi:hypothetical protein ACXWOO_10665, partial [Streptococcus pyogenes]
RLRQLRTQRDKFTDLLRRQKLATRDRTRSKSGPQGDANQRTAQKVQVFDEALQRLQTLANRREAQWTREAARAQAAAAREARPA